MTVLCMNYSGFLNRWSQVQILFRVPFFYPRAGTRKIPADSFEKILQLIDDPAQGGVHAGLDPIPFAGQSARHAQK